MSLLTGLTNSWMYKYRDALLLMACSILIYFVVKKPKTVLIPTDNPVQLQQVQQFRDENGKLYAQISQQVLELSQAKAYNDSLAKALKLKPKYIQGVDIITTKDSIV